MAEDTAKMSRITDRAPDIAAKFQRGKAHGGVEAAGSGVGIEGDRTEGAAGTEVTADVVFFP